MKHIICCQQLQPHEPWSLYPCRFTFDHLSICYPEKPPALCLGKKIHPVGKVCKLNGLMWVTQVNTAPSWSQNGLQLSLTTAAPNSHIYKELRCNIIAVDTWIIYRPCCLDNRHSNLVAHTARISFCINLPFIIDMKINFFLFVFCK